ncbi:hypothetical protein SAMN04489712_113138 [Thermomonospora echinospora]|uniref:Uncharacterized protein n=1 Tax=Thermomonospora echinospora TaxID=1992 RepID=A0A1H6D6X3_9ACTN|nr:DUF6082 family protein [Thermomonospora echinospora]SEG80718.1 hypothetical protein SAMN04489712_113138 [Thermomonospora echinospora]
MPSSRRPARQGARRWSSIALILVLVAIVGAFGVSPFLLDAYDGSAAQWERRSLIGQTYGAASAILSVLALLGVVVTLVLQARETALAREEARRTAIADLLRMAMDDPDLDACWGPVPAGQDLRTRRQQLYINMIVSEWRMSFETGALGPARLRAIAAEMFSGEPGRLYWESARHRRLSTSQSRKARRFHEILDEEYRRIHPPPDRRPGGSTVGGGEL